MKKISVGKDKFALVDNEFGYFSQWKWSLATNNHINYYAKRRIVKAGILEVVLMHRLIMNAPKYLFVDHINGDGLDNRKVNLRLCYHWENIANQRMHKNNTSGYKGVHWSKEKNKWKSEIKVNYKNIHLGYFDDKIEAARTYDKASKIYHGEYGRTNF